MGARAPITDPAPELSRRPWRRVMHAVRRAHMYLGLALLPWAVMYGVTAFLFNHPTAFSDRPTATFDRSAFAGTPMDNPPAPADVAGQVVAALRERATPPADYTLVEPEAARYTREFAFATVKTGGPSVGVLIDPAGRGGTVRQSPPPAESVAVERAPFAVGGEAPTGSPRPLRAATGGLTLPDALHERVKAATPAVLERIGFPAGDVTVTSVPDLTFRMRDGAGTVWQVTYNAMTGAVSGRPADAVPASEPLSARRYLLRLHTAHGYPPAGGPRWWWAVVVDATAAVMVFWGLSGLVMWWQVKAARAWGAVVLLASAVAAAALAAGMHTAMTV